MRYVIFSQGVNSSSTIVRAARQFGHESMSTQSTTKRQGVSLYDMLSRQSSAQAQIVHQKHRLDSAKSLPWPGDKKD